MTKPVAFRGEVALEIGDRALTLRLTWAAHDRLLELMGDDYGPSRNMRELSVIVSELSGGEISADEVYALSPPIQPVTAAVEKALLLGWLGPEAAREREEAGGDDPFGLSRLVAALRGFWGGRSKPASTPSASGA